MSYSNPLFLLVNLCNPNNEPEQVQTIEKVKLGIDQLDPDHDCHIILGGDFNLSKIHNMMLMEAHRL